MGWGHETGRNAGLSGMIGCRRRFRLSSELTGAAKQVGILVEWYDWMSKEVLSEGLCENADLLSRFRL
jgi:hypothetical protein